MDKNAVAVDLTYVRDVAHGVTEAAEAIAALRFPGVSAQDLPGSAISGADFPGAAALRRDAVTANMLAWASAARRSAGDFHDADRRSASHLDPS